ncbi:hypothetical protein EII29_04785 [Leptotrichia sp. OH3620_COT-345]|uniref:hypothetical protein n=1 Tax=Leptotrichia sp. OH3620_COT-345 TaxID=2491048 RepID=UPI000F6502AD|nr:hypothetical protein [Leptotrichia sp. OH3620_COT-345]RRD39841.1 hypothetical protein EII29_04785 [Leptotrichia sp. OH3620_COT-345]
MEKNNLERSFERISFHKKMEFEKMNEEINDKKFSQNSNYKFKNNDKEKNKYYHIENLELDSQKILERVKGHEREIELE